MRSSVGRTYRVLHVLWQATRRIGYRRYSRIWSQYLCRLYKRRKTNSVIQWQPSHWTAQDLGDDSAVIQPDGQIVPIIRRRGRHAAIRPGIRRVGANPHGTFGLGGGVAEPCVHAIGDKVRTNSFHCGFHDISIFLIVVGKLF